MSSFWGAVQLTSVTVNGQTTTFVYDGDGNLVRKIKPDGTSTAYVGGVYEVELSAGGQITKKTSYYGAAMRVEIVGVSNTLYYVLRDHLGSASVTLDASGNVVANGEQRYYPFGESRIAGASLPTDRLYTGQRDTGLGLYHYGARFYLSKLGRFLSADTLVPSPGNPQSYNRYSYVYNSPINLVDPSGHEACYDTGVEIGSGISQAGCWAYGRDKWQLGLPVAAPVAGEGYNTIDRLSATLRWSLQSDAGGIASETLYRIFERDALAAVHWVASYYGINLPPGYSWYFDSTYIDPQFGTIYGWNPVSPNEPFYVQGIIDITAANDNYVYIFTAAFTAYNFDPAGVVATLIHEGRHAWQEYYVDLAGGDFESIYIPVLEIDAYNTELAIAVDYGIITSEAAREDARSGRAAYRELCPGCVGLLSIPFDGEFGGHPSVLTCRFRSVGC